MDRKSRYKSSPKLVYNSGSGAQTVYLGRRFLPQGETLRDLKTETVRQNDRPDLVATRALGDPLLFWRICDANNAMNPFSTTSIPNRRLRVPMPEPTD